MMFVLSAALAVAVGVATSTGRIYWLSKGPVHSSEESVTMQASKEDLSMLAAFPNLKKADLSGSPDFDAVLEWSEQHPEIDVDYTVELPEGAAFDPETGVMDLTALSPQEVIEAAPLLRKMLKARTVKLDLQPWTADQTAEFLEKCERFSVSGEKVFEGESADSVGAMIRMLPDMVCSGTYTAGGVRLAIGERNADLSRMTEEGFAQLESLYTALDLFDSVDFGTEKDAHTKLPFVHSFAQNHPDVSVAYKFGAFGKTISYHDKKLDLNHITMKDQGAEVREIISCMPDLTYLDMDFCGVDDKHMAAIRDDFPKVEVVWRIWFGERFTVRTDAIKIFASANYMGGELTPKNTASLKYCTKMKYIDIGHMNYLQSIDFVKYMPDLEVLICMMGNITDISPLAYCKHLEFLEIQTNSITDLSPLAELHELKHLNICYNTELKDMSPLFGLTQLERLWIGKKTQIPKSQIDQFRKLAPKCVVNDTCSDPHDNWRWPHPRYYLLKKQFGYATRDYSVPEKDPLYKPHN